MSRIQALKNLIREDIENDTVPRGPGGRIERIGYARQLGVTKSAMSGYAKVFADFESEVGVETRVDGLIPEIESLFIKLLNDGTLEFANGVPSRKQLLDPFGLWGGGVPKRCSGLRAMLEWCDQEARRLSYMPQSIRNRVEKLRRALATGVYDNPSTGKLHNRALRIHLGFPGDAAYPDYMRGIVEQHELAFRKTLEDDTLVRFYIDKPYTLREFILLGWTEEVLEKIIWSFFEEFSNKRAASFSENFNALKNLLSLIATSKDSSGKDVFRYMVERVRINNIEKNTSRFADCIESDIHRSSKSAHTVNHLVDATNRVLSLFARTGFLVSFIKLKRRIVDQPSPRPTMLEIHAERLSAESPEEAEKGRLQTLIDFAQEKLKLANSDVTAHLANEDAEAFFETLRDEFADLPQEVRADPVRAMLHIINVRDNILRVHFVGQVKEWGDHFRRGQELLKEGIDPTSYWNDDFVAGNGEVGLRDVFPDSEGRRDFAVANLLRLVRTIFDGIIPNYGYSDPKVRNFFIRRCRELGGRKLLMAYLFPHRNLVGSVLSLYLMDSGANVAVGRSLAPDCIRASDEEGYWIVLGNKEKAAGKPIIIYLEEDGDALSGMLTWQAHLPAFSYLAEKTLSEFFFAVEIGGKIKPISEAWFLGWFKKESGSLKHFKERGICALPSSQRPTVLMKAVLDHGGQTRYAITLAQHTTGVSSSYYSRFPIRLMHEVEQRHCQQIMETIAVHSHPEGPSYIGVSKAEFDRRLEEFEPTGFGMQCGNQFGHPKRAGQSCETFDCWRCDKGILIAEPESIAPLIQWGCVLAAEEGNWVRDHPERWAEYFLGWQVFIVFVEETMQQPHLIHIWDEAASLAAATMADPMYRPLLPWS